MGNLSGRVAVSVVAASGILASPGTTPSRDTSLCIEQPQASGPHFDQLPP